MNSQIFCKESYIPNQTENNTPTPSSFQKSKSDIRAMLNEHVSSPACRKDAERLSVSQILHHLGIINPNKAQLNHAGKILREMKIETYKSNGLTRRLVKLI